jgi:hypothetical protein
MFEACLTLPKDPREAQLLADNLDALARALRDWPDDAWRKATAHPAQPAEGSSGLFERLVARTAPAALEPRKRRRAMRSAAAAADVLRVLWPEQAATIQATPAEVARAA